MMSDYGQAGHANNAVDGVVVARRVWPLSRALEYSAPNSEAPRVHMTFEQKVSLSRRDANQMLQCLLMPTTFPTRKIGPQSPSGTTTVSQEELVFRGVLGQQCVTQYQPLS